MTEAIQNNLNADDVFGKFQDTTGMEGKEAVYSLPLGKYKARLGSMTTSHKEKKGKMRSDAYFFEFPVTGLKPIEGVDYLDADKNPYTMEEVTEMANDAREQSHSFMLSDPESPDVTERASAKELKNLKFQIQTATGLSKDKIAATPVPTLLRLFEDQEVEFYLEEHKVERDGQTRTYTRISREGFRLLLADTGAATTTDGAAAAV